MQRFAFVMAVGVCASLVGCSSPPPADDPEPRVDASVVTDRGQTVTDRGNVAVPMDTGSVEPEDSGSWTVVDASEPVDNGPPPPVDAGCEYEPVLPDRNGEPRNADGQIRWCWPGEPACHCDRDNDCYRESGYRPLCRPAGTVTVDAGNGPVDTGVTPPRDTGNTTPTDTGNTNSGMGLCTDPVPASTTGMQINLETINFNWSMQCYRPEDGSLFVFVEDTERAMVALRFYDFLNNGGPATGQTIDLATVRAPMRPFFVSSLSGIVLEPSWSAAHSYIAYEGQVIFHQLQRTNPIGSTMRVEFRNVRLREVRQYTNGRCENVTNGARMFIRSINLNLRVNNIHTDQDCIDWAGG